MMVWCASLVHRKSVFTSNVKLHFQQALHALTRHKSASSPCPTESLLPLPELAWLLLAGPAELHRTAPGGSEPVDSTKSPQLAIVGFSYYRWSFAPSLVLRTIGGLSHYRRLSSLSPHRSASPDHTADPHSPHSRPAPPACQPIFSFSRSMVSWGLAFPRVFPMTWPMMACRAFSFPA